MTPKAESSHNSLFTVLTFCAALYIIGRFIFVRRLRSLSVDTWRELGEPHDLAGDSRADWAVLKYLFMGRYGSLPDTGFVIFCHCYRAFLAIWIFGFILFVILFLYVGLTTKA